MLSEDILLEIFDFYRLDAMERRQTRGRPWKWLHLAHVCRRWRHAISMSPRRLDLQILCKYGASIKYTLDAWETLPLIVRFKGGPKSKSLPENIVTALCRPDRVREIDLDLTSTTVGAIVDEIKKPFQMLESIRISIKDATGPSLLFRSGFLGGSAPRLREIDLDGITFPFPEIKQVFSSTNNLVRLHLTKIPETGYFSVDTLVTALSSSTQLRALGVGFHYPASLPTQSNTSPPFQRTTFPFLITLRFHGASEYLEEFVSRVDFPSLGFIDIKLFHQIFFEIPEFCRTIPLLNAFMSPTEMEIKSGKDSVAMYFRQKGKHGIKSGDCYLRTVCERLDWQLSFVTEVSRQLFPLLESVGTLTISGNNIMPTLPSEEEDMDSTQWLEVFQPFTHLRELHIPGKFVLDILQALVTEDMAAGVFPELTRLSVAGVNKRNSATVVEAAEQFVAARKLSGRTIRLSK